MAFFVFHRPVQGAPPWGLGGRETTEEGEFVFPFAPLGELGKERVVFGKTRVGSYF